jgi:hypothetical protein
VIHRMKCERVRYQGYLRRKEVVITSGAPPGANEEHGDASIQLSMPVWVVFGYWDSQKCMFIYKNTEVLSLNVLIC